MSTAPALTDRPYSKTQLFCSNLPWSVNGKVKDAQARCTPHVHLPARAHALSSASLPLCPSAPLPCQTP